MWSTSKAGWQQPSKILDPNKRNGGLIPLAVARRMSGRYRYACISSTLYFVSGLKAESISAELTTFVPGRRLDDNVQALMRFEGGAKASHVVFTDCHRKRK